MPFNRLFHRAHIRVSIALDVCSVIGGACATMKSVSSTGHYVQASVAYAIHSVFSTARVELDLGRKRNNNNEQLI